MCWENLPKDRSPLEHDVADIEGVQDPRPLIVTEVKIFVESGSLGVADISWLFDEIGGLDEWVGYAYRDPNMIECIEYIQLARRGDQTRL